MKKIVDCKLYDTDTAQEIASYGNNLPLSDFRFKSETLYRTPNGSYFLHGYGGAMTEYSKTLSDNSVIASENIRPISDQDAFIWLSQFDPDMACDLFPDIVIIA